MNKVIIGGVFAVLCLLFTVGYLIGLDNNNQKNKNNSFTPTGTEVINSQTVQRLWGDAPDDTAIPALLTKDDYIYMYQQAVQSIKSRNFEDFSKLISYQRFWRLNYKLIEFLPFENGMPVLKVEKGDPRQNFYDFSILNILNYSPNPGQVVVEKMEHEDNALSDNTPMRYYNTEQGIDMLINQSGYKHTVTLTCHTVGSEYFSGAGSGKIVFVYDKGEWRFDWEYWDDQTVLSENININKDFGDIADTSTEIVFDRQARLDQQNYDLGTTTIQKGQTVKWKNAEGVVQSYMQLPTDINWSSPFMNKGSYFKKYNDAGTYPYQIIYSDTIFFGKIVVQ